MGSRAGALWGAGGWAGERTASQARRSAESDRVSRQRACRKPYPAAPAPSPAASRRARAAVCSDAGSIRAAREMGGNREGGRRLESDCTRVCGAGGAGMSGLMWGHNLDFLVSLAVPGPAPQARALPYQETLVGVRVERCSGWEELKRVITRRLCSFPYSW